MRGFGGFCVVIGVLAALFLNILIGILLLILGVICIGFGSRDAKAFVIAEDYVVAKRDRISPEKAAMQRAARELDRKPCPHCAEPILRAAKVCHFCGRDLADDWATPLLLTRRAR